jgi:hypothetical protein
MNAHAGRIGVTVLIAAFVCVPLRTNAQARAGTMSVAVSRAPVFVAPTTRKAPGSYAAPSPLSGAPRGGRTKNAIYGMIVQIVGNVLTIRNRAGRLRTIDASPALAAGTYSGPLFVGKIVVAEGLTRSDGVLTAARVSRLTRLTDSNPDR